MILINEWLPNPAGKDAGSEWVELANTGASAVDLGGWRLVIGAKKKVPLDGYRIEPGGYAVVRPKSGATLGLRNSEGSAGLYDGAGRLVDEAQFRGTAPEGKSYARLASGSRMWSDPTPGAANRQESLQASVITATYPAGVPLNAATGAAGLLALTLASAAVLTGLLLFAIKRHVDLSDLFFGRDQAPR